MRRAARTALALVLALLLMATGANAAWQSGATGSTQQVKAAELTPPASIATTSNGDGTTTATWPEAKLDGAQNTAIKYTLTKDQSTLCGPAASLASCTFPYASGTSVRWWGTGQFGIQTYPAPTKKVVKTATAAGANGVFGLLSDGTLKQIDSNTDPCYTKNFASRTAGKTFTDVVAGSCSYAGLSTDGTVVTWGGSSYTDTNLSRLAGKRVVKIYASAQRFAAITDTGEAILLGFDAYQPESGYSAAPVKDLALGTYHPVILRQDGSLVQIGTDAGWGIYTNFNARTSGRTFSKVYAADRTTMAIEAGTGQVIQWGHISAEDGLSKLAGVSVKSIDLEKNGYNGLHIAVTTDGRLAVWGKIHASNHIESEYAALPFKPIDFAVHGRGVGNSASVVLVDDDGTTAEVGGGSAGDSATGKYSAGTNGASVPQFATQVHAGPNSFSAEVESPPPSLKITATLGTNWTASRSNS